MSSQQDDVKDVADRVELDESDLMDPVHSAPARVAAEPDNFNFAYSGKANWFRKLTLVQHASGMLVGGGLLMPYFFSLLGVSVPIDQVSQASGRAWDAFRHWVTTPIPSNVFSAAISIHIVSGVSKTLIRRQGKKDDEEIIRLTPRTWERWTGYGLIFLGSVYYYRNRILDVEFVSSIVKKLPNWINSDWINPVMLTTIVGTMSYHHFTAPSYVFPTIRSIFPSFDHKPAPPVAVKALIALSVAGSLSAWLYPTSTLQASAYKQLSSLLTA